jgi:predicted NAD/FAD-binding protein
MTQFNRREVLGALIAGSALPGQGFRMPRKRKVAIVGGGMAGVSLAWLLDGLCDVVLLEARPTLGGNVQAVDVDLGGHPVVVDMGAQYFHPAPYPAYTALLAHLGLHTPDLPGQSPSRPFTASITLTADGEPFPRFVSPIVPERLWPFLTWWNFAGLLTFGLGFIAAAYREQQNESWSVTLEEWLPTLGFAQPQWEGMLLPWAASLFSGDVEQARGMSARAAMFFAAKALPPNPFDPIHYYTLSPGMGDALSRMVAQLSSAEVLTGTKVLNVSREPQGNLRVHCGPGRDFKVDDVVFAASGPPAQRLLEGLPGTNLQLAALRRMEFHDAHLALHTDAIYAPADEQHWSFLNCHAQGGFCESSMWLSPVVGPPGEQVADIFKSWITHRTQDPAGILHEARFTHMLPTPATLLGQTELLSLQGRDGIWFAGGFLSPYDSQESALRSALRVAVDLNATSARSDFLLAALGSEEL